MVTFKYLQYLLFMFINYFHLTVQENTVSLSFPLTVARLSGESTFNPNLFPLSNKARRFDQKNAAASPPRVNYRSLFRYSMALIVPFPIGTPTQTQQMVLDTGSQLSWIQCDQQKTTKKKWPQTASFKPSLSSSFSRVPCNDRACPVRDFSLGGTCDKKYRTCHYSYFYADGTLAEGSLVREKATFSGSALPLILGCTNTMDSSGAQGILGMNLGRLSFISQINVSKFSYCVPANNNNNNLKGTFYLGHNPSSHSFQYMNLLTYPQSETQVMPNFDPLAYTVGLLAITIGGKKLNIPKETFLPDHGGSGQTIIDSGSQYTILVEDAYAEVKKQVVHLTSSSLKEGYVYKDLFEMCFDDDPKKIGKMIGDMVFHFGNGVNISIHGERNLVNVGGGVKCFAILSPRSLGIASNIIGNFHQQSLWVEYDVTNRLVGFGRADCSKFT